MRKQPRKGNGRYKQSSWYNFRKKKRGWREYAISPITVSVFGCLVWLGANTAWAMNELEKLDGKIDIYNFSTDFTKFESESIREDSEGAGFSPAPNPEESTGETVSAVSESKPRESVEGSTPAMEQSPSTVEAKILKAWEGTGKGHIAVAVAKSESGLRSNAMGWNCHYYDAQGKRYSKACNPEDRPKAWSVDCGVMQINHIGKTCPSHLFDPDENIRIGRDMFENRGFSPWVAFTKGLYLQYL